MLGHPAITPTITPTPTLDAITLARIKEYATDRGLASYDVSEWLGLCEDSHQQQASILGGTRKTWTIKLPKATEADVDQVVGDYLALVRSTIFGVGV